MQENMIRISCPECQTHYRVDPSAVPEEGASAACKKCRRKFTILRNRNGLFTRLNPLPPAGQETQEEIRFVCPRCGHHQIQPFTCYVCGAVITPKNAPDKSATEPATSSGFQTADPVHPFMGKIVVRCQMKSLRWIQSITRIHITIDGMDSAREWGVHAFEVPKGDSTIVVQYKFLFRSYGRNSLDVHVAAEEKIYINYFVKTPFSVLPASIAKASLAEGTLWPAPAPPVSRGGKRFSSRKAVIWGLILLGPLGLLPLWRSDDFPFKAKLAITAAMILIILLIVSKL